jgi:hypothetical protein
MYFKYSVMINFNGKKTKNYQQSRTCFYYYFYYYYYIIIPFRFLFPNLIIHVNFCDFSSFSLFLTYKEKSSPTNNITSFYRDLLHLQNLAASQLLLRKK